jgi:hypothetical protein
MGGDPIYFETELPVAMGKLPMATEWRDGPTFCAALGWSRLRARFDRWQASHFKTEAGR